MSEFSTYHGPHPAMACADAVAVTWREPTARADRVRVRAHTCSCQSVVYELCAASGLYFIRRIDSRQRPPAIVETDWDVWRKAEALWRRIFSGLAR